ncbi:MAG: hypothetical protein WD894_12425 [Pirellulales bacterium]
MDGFLQSRNVPFSNLYRALAALWNGKGQDPRHIRVKIATRFTRLVFQLVSGRQVLRHPGMRGRDAILDKLMKFHLDHRTPMTTLLRNLQEAVTQLPAGSHAEEAAPLVELKKVQASRRGARPIGKDLAVGAGQAGGRRFTIRSGSGVQLAVRWIAGSIPSHCPLGLSNRLRFGTPSEKPDALSRSRTSDKAVWSSRASSCTSMTRT